MNKIVILKILSTILTIGGVITSNWVGEKEQTIKLEELVNEKLKRNERDS